MLKNDRLGRTLFLPLSTWGCLCDALQRLLSLTLEFNLWLGTEQQLAELEMYVCNHQI